MKTTIVTTLVLVTVTLILSCSKGKFATTPRIEVKSYSTKEVPVNGGLTIRLTYYDKEGDLGKGGFWAARYRRNILPLPAGLNKPDTLDVAHGYNIPDFPARDKGDIFLELDYNFLKESPVENDTIYFRIAVTDVKGNASDTITTDNIVIHR